MKKKIAIIYGTRPEYLKLKELIKLIPKSKRDIIFVGQHDKLLDKNYFTRKIKITKKSDHRLNTIFSDVLKKLDLSKYETIIVQGDTATTCATALAAFNNKKKIVYIESGLRSFDMNNPFPEEGYRQIISRIADINFAPTNLSKNNLVKEKVKGKTYVVGNTSLDNLLLLKKKNIYTNLVLITLHRRENLSIIDKWFKVINKLSKKYHNLEFVYPVHANPVIKEKLKILNNNVKKVESLSHHKMLEYIKKTKFIITDSGGIQEEGSFLNKKVIVCRKVTERPEAINTGHIKICKDPGKLFKIFEKINKKFKINKPCPYGDGRSSKRIVSILKSENFL